MTQTEAAVGIPSVKRGKPAPDDSPAIHRATVTIVIPCFNYAQYLKAAVDSALDQDLVDVDVVIVDDDSTDESLAVATRLASRDSRIHVIAHARNVGAVLTFNDGLKRATGEFLVRLDADDMLTPGSLRRAVAVARAFPSVGLVYGHPVHFTAAEPPAAQCEVRSWTVWPGVVWLAERCRAATSVITAPEVLMRRSVVERVGGQRDLPHAHDTEMWMRIAAFSDVAHIDGADQAYHRGHPGSLSSSVGIVQDLEERRLAYRILFAGQAASLTESARLLPLAMRALAAEALTVVCRDYERGRHGDPRVDRLIEFAKATHDLDDLKQWRAVQRRQQLRRSVFRSVPVFAGHVVARRIQAWIKYRKWVNYGI